MIINQKNFNFVLTEKKIYAINKLNKIKNKLLIQLGGSLLMNDQNSVQNIFNLIDTGIVNNNVDENLYIYRQIIQQIPLNRLTNNQQLKLNILLNADDELDNQFRNMILFFNNHHGYNNIIESLNRIYKTLYKTQVKLILKEAEQLNIPPLEPFLKALDNKLKAMDDAINNI